MVSIWESLYPHHLTAIVAGTAEVAAMLILQNSRIQKRGSISRTGKMITPFGAEIISYPAISGQCILALTAAARLKRCRRATCLRNMISLLTASLKGQLFQPFAASQSFMTMLQRFSFTLITIN
jgi:hypothetical protein